MRKDLDTIYLKRSELQGILDWRNENQIAVRNFRDVFEEGLIVAEDRKTYIHFKVNGDLIDYRYYFKDVLVCHALTRRLGESYTIVTVGNREDYGVDVKNPYFNRYLREGMSHKDLLEEFVQDNTTIHCSVMAYLTYKATEVEIKEVDFLSPSRLKKTLRHNKYNPNKQIKIKKKVIYLKDPTFKKVTRSDFVRVTQSWGVRGHYRKQNGKQVWVRPHVKGKGAKKHKEYTVEVKI